LARAQLLATHGRATDALSIASELASNAQTALLREKASALASRLSKNSEPPSTRQEGVGEQP
jgi:hypothetical protein